MLRVADRTDTPPSPDLGVSSSWAYHAGAARLWDDEVMVVTDGRVEYAVTRREHFLSFGATIPVNYTTAFQPVPHDLRQFVLDLVRFTKKCVVTSDCDWLRGDRASLSDTECLHRANAAFPLPESFERYLESLSKKHRYDARAVLKQAEALTVRYEWPTQMDAIWACYEAYCHQTFEESDTFTTAPQRVGCVQLFAEEARQLGTLFPLAVYEGDRLIAVNVAEQVGLRVLDACALYTPDARDQYAIGKFMILENIRHAIAAKLIWYDLGPVEDITGSREHLEYKSRFVPHGVRLPYSLNFAAVTGQPAIAFVRPFYNADLEEVVS